MTGATGGAALERRLFEILGGWVPVVPEPEAKLLLRSHSFQHAWHASLWDGLGGAGAHHQPDLGDVWTMVEALPAPGTEPVTADRLRAVYEGVLPALVRAYRAVLDAASPLTDGALVRAVRLMVADDDVAAAEGRRVLAAMSGMRGAAGDSKM